MSQNQLNNFTNNTNAEYNYSSDIQQLTDKFNNDIEHSQIQLKQLLSDMTIFSKDTELSFITEELELTKLQKNLLQLKYDLLQDTNENLITKNKAMSDQLEAYTCSICLTNAKDCILEPCGHFVGCMSCISLLPDTNCPVCRTVCNYYIRVFNS